MSTRRTLRGDSFGWRLRLRQLQDERYVDGLVVEEDAVCVFAMRAQAFAVIGHHQDGCACVELSVAFSAATSLPIAVSAAP